MDSYLGAIFRNKDGKLLVLQPHKRAAYAIKESGTSRYADLPDDCYEVVRVVDSGEGQVITPLGRMLCCCPPPGTPKVQSVASEWPTPAWEAIEEQMADDCSRMEFIHRLHDCLKL